MNFIEFLTEAPQYNTVNMGNTGKAFAGARPAAHVRDPAPKQPKQGRQKKPSPMQATQQQQPQPANKPVDPQGDADLKQFLDASKANRQDAVNMITLLGSIYQARKTNPSVELSDTPKMANTPLLVNLFKLAKDKQLPQLAAMSQEIKKASTVDPTKGTAPAGANPAVAGAAQPATPAQGAQQPAAGAPQPEHQQGSSPAQQTQLQQLMDIINKTAPNLTTRQIKAASRQLNQKAKNAMPPTNPGAPQPNSGQVINTG